MTTNNLNKIERLLSLMDNDGMTTEQFLKHFSLVLEIVKKNKEFNEEEKRKLQAKYDNLTETVEKFYQTAEGNLEETKRKALAYCVANYSQMALDYSKAEVAKMNEKIDKKIATIKNGKDADENSVIRKSSSIVINATKSVLPGIIKDKIPSLGEPIRDSLENLPDGKKLSVNAVEELPEKLEELKDLVKKKNGTVYYGGGASTGSSSSSPGGSDTQVQFNDGGSLGGDSGLTYNKTTDSLTVAGPVVGTGGMTISGGTTNINLTGNRTTNINTGATFGTVNIGGSSENADINIEGANVSLTSSAGELHIEALNLNLDTNNAAKQIVIGNTNAGTTLRLLSGTAGVKITPSLLPSSDDGAALGSTSLEWSDLFLASGAVINYADSNVVITHSSGILTVGTGDLRVSTAGTNSASVVTVGGTQTLTSKTLTSPTLTTPSAFTTGGTITLAENTSIALDPAGSADGKYTGITIAGTAGTTLAFGDLVYLAAADSRWELADADAASTSGDVMLGMCVLAAAADGSATTILLYGNIRADANFPTLTIGAPAYVSTTAGDIQTAQPSGTDDVIRRVGFALTADELLFNPSNDYVTHT